MNSRRHSLILVGTKVSWPMSRNMRFTGHVIGITADGHLQVARANDVYWVESRKAKVLA